MDIDLSDCLTLTRAVSIGICELRSSPSRRRTQELERGAWRSQYASHGGIGGDYVARGDVKCREDAELFHDVLLSEVGNGVRVGGCGGLGKDGTDVVHNLMIRTEIPLETINEQMELAVLERPGKYESTGAETVEQRVLTLNSVVAIPTPPTCQMMLWTEGFNGLSRRSTSVASHVIQPYCEGSNSRSANM